MEKRYVIKYQAKRYSMRVGVVVLLSTLVLFVSPVRIAFASPVAPDEVELQQPDGTSFKAIPYGDEWYSGVEFGNFTILIDVSTGYWMYAEQLSNGQLIPGKSRVGIDESPSALSPHLRDSVAIEQVEHARSESLSLLPQDLEPEMGAPMAVSGSHPVLILLVDFSPSTSLGTSDSQWSNTFFDNTTGIKSVKNYYEEASYGNFTLDPVVETYGLANDGVIAVTLPYVHPNPYPTNDNNRLIVLNALNEADPYIDFGALDSDSSGGLDVNELHLMVIVRGFEKSYGGTTNACTPSVWGHRWSLGGTVSAPTLDGVLVANYASGGGYTQEGEWHEQIGSGCTGSSGQMATIGIMAHELGHDIGWPDLYDTDLSSEGVGYWSVMGSGSWGRASGEASGTTPVLPDAFLKWYQDWLVPIQVTAPTSSVAIPNSAQNAIVYQLGENINGVDWEFGISSGAGEYFLIENRQPIGFDAGLWRIDLAGNAKGCVI